MIKYRQICTSKSYLSVIFLMLICGAAFAGSTDYWNQSNEKNPAFVDHSIWQKILDKYLMTNHPSGVNRFRYSDLSETDKRVLENYLNSLQQIDPRKLKRAEQKAYWINLYNALTVNLIVANYPVKSIKKVGNGFFSFGPWDDDIAKITGQTLTLNEIEHKILRPIWKDPRIHYAVNCASIGCPNLSPKVYTRDNMDVLLDKGARDYINHQRGVSLQKGKLLVSSIYHWYKEDFGGNNQQLISHLQNYAADYLRQALDDFDGSIDHDYNWSLNDAR